jgi:hypothetical protein
VIGDGGVSFIRTGNLSVHIVSLLFIVRIEKGRWVGMEARRRSAVKCFVLFDVARLRKTKKVVNG